MSRGFSKFGRDLALPWHRNPMTGSAAAFLWGPRQTGKSTLLRGLLPEAQFFDLLDTGLCAELMIRPGKIREEILADRPEEVVIDEIQKVPELLEEVHWLLENTATRFILCGSSARKLRRGAGNLLGGRAVEFHLHPLTSAEIGEVQLERVLNYGSLPVHYLADEPAPLLKAYVNAYVKEEIIEESVTRNVPGFSRFLESIGLTCGQQLNYTNLARESGVSASTVRNYFQILTDTLLGFTLEPWRRSVKRRLVDTAKFYLFDVGVARALHPEFGPIAAGSDLFGRAFEHFLLNEVRAFLDYRRLDHPVRFWRTSSGFEVDLIVGDMDLALEFKSSSRLRPTDLRGLKALLEEQKVRRSILVNREASPRILEQGIEVLPWREFCRQLWSGELLSP